MRKRANKFLSLLLASAFIFTSCNNSEVVVSPDKQDSEKVAEIPDITKEQGKYISLSNDYNVSKIELNEQIYSINDIVCNDSKIYLRGLEEGFETDFHVAVHDFQTSTDEYVKINMPEQFEYESMIITDTIISEDYCFISGYIDYKDEYGKGKSLAMIASYNQAENKIEKINYYDQDLFTGFSYDNKKKKFYAVDSSLKLYEFDSQLQFKAEYDISDKVKSALKSDSNYRIYSIEIDKNGNLYIEVYDSENYEYGIVVFDDNFEVIKSFSEDDLSDLGGAFFMTTLSNGLVSFYSNDDKYMYFDVVDPESLCINEMYEVEREGNDFYFNLCNDVDYVVQTEIGVEGYILGKEEPVFSFGYVSEDSVWSAFRCVYIDDEKIYEILPPGLTMKNIIYILDNKGEIIDSVNADYGEKLLVGDDGKPKMCIRKLVVNDINLEDDINDIDSSGDVLIHLSEVDSTWFDDITHMICTQDGEIISEFKFDSFVDIVGMTKKDGVYYLYYIDRKQEKIYLYNTEDNSKQEISIINDNIEIKENTRFINGESVYDLYIRDDKSYYGYNAESDLFVKIIDDIRTLEIDNIKSVKAIDEYGNLLCEVGDSDIYILSPTNENSGKQIIELAYIGDSASNIPDDYVMSFNEKNTDYKVNVRTYEKESDINLDIVSENIPDIIISDSSDSLSSYADKGLFTDMINLIENDPEFSKYDFLQNIICAYNSKEKIYKIFPQFTISTLLGKSELSSEKWDYDSFLNFSEKSGDKTLFDYWLRSEVFMKFMYCYVSDFVDIENRKCDFDNDVFKNLLKFVKSQLYCDNEQYGKGHNRDCISQGGLEITTFNIDSFESVDWMEELSDDTYFIKGYPSLEGGQNLIKPNICFSITEQCENKDIAWEFIRYFFTDEYQNTLADKYSSYFPVKKSAYEAKLEESQMNRSEYALQVDEIIRTASRTAQIDSEISEIIEEELIGYFEGEISEEQVAQSIQPKMNLFINERY